MKRITTLAIICLSFCQLVAQNLPQGIAYQAVAVKDGPYSIAGQNPQAIYWSNKDFNVRFTIYEKYPGGTNQFSETHATKTDDYGVFNLIIGQGNLISGDFTKIPWDLGTAHLQVEIDFDNNGAYKLTSLERFWSVPYAFVTKKSSSTSTDSAFNALNTKFNYLKNRDKDTVVGNEGGVSYKSLDSLNKVLVAKLAAFKAADKDTVIGNEWQKITRNNDTLVLSDGGGKVTLLDEDPKNEIQQISIAGDTISLSSGGFVKLPNYQSISSYKKFGIADSTHGAIIAYSDDTISWVVPKGISEITVAIWGANGGNSGWSYTQQFYGAQGRGMDGIFKIHVTSNDSFKLLTGKNGVNGVNHSDWCPHSDLKGTDATDTRILYNGNEMVRATGGKGGLSKAFSCGWNFSCCGISGSDGDLYFLGNSVLNAQYIHSLISLGPEPYGIKDFSYGFDLQFKSFMNSPAVLILY